MLPQNTKIDAYSIDNPLCSVAVNRSLTNEVWPNLDQEIMHDITRNVYNGPTDILVGMDNYWKFKFSNILPHSSHQFGIVTTNFGWTPSGNLSSITNLVKTQLCHQRISINMEKVTEIEK